MKRFWLQIGVFFSGLVILVVIVFFSADGYSDGIYLKFTTPKQTSLVIGTSKAAQGIHPKVLNKVLKREDIYNYGFTVIHSPFGPAYLKSIKNKLKRSKDGVFIIAVDPHSISSKTEDPNDILNFRENATAVGAIENVNTYPNFEYLLFHYPEQYIYILTRKLKYVSQGLLHEDGLVETGLSTDPELVQQRVNQKIESYTRQSKEYKFSEVRLQYLEKTIHYLKKHGNVYIVRLPVIEPLLNLENSIIPDFDEKIEAICAKNTLQYLNFSDRARSYTYDDGNHLDSESGKILTREIGEWIKSMEKKK